MQTHNLKGALKQTPATMKKKKKSKLRTVNKKETVKYPDPKIEPRVLHPDPLTYNGKEIPINSNIIE